MNYSIEVLKKFYAVISLSSSCFCFLNKYNFLCDKYCFNNFHKSFYATYKKEVEDILIHLPFRYNTINLIVIYYLE